MLSTTEVGGRPHGGARRRRVLAEFNAARQRQYELESGGTIRKMHHSVDGLVTFAVATAEAASGETIEPSEFEAGDEAWIDYRGPPGTLRNIPYSRVLEGKVPDSAFRGKTVIVGATAPSLQDVHPTSTTGTA